MRLDQLVKEGGFRAVAFIANGTTNWAGFLAG
jgi:hypothetical protein